MKRLTWLGLSLLAAVLTSGCQTAFPGGGHVLTQVSTIDALMVGCYEGPATVADVRSWGDLGLGTFAHLDGEMVMLDHTVYQVTSDGVVHKPEQAMHVPFAVATWFSPTASQPLAHGVDPTELGTVVSSLVASPNLPVAFRVDGTFTLVQVRSVPRQTPPYQPLTEVVKTQPRFNLANVKGTLIGFRCPAYLKGVNVVGYHMHFISADREQGGHVLNFLLDKGTIQVDALTEVRLRLPNDEGFYRADLSEDRSEAVHKVEK